MEKPTSDALRAGPSLVPSPVTATTLPISLSLWGKKKTKKKTEESRKQLA
jgi:hypothetical protein